jgi:hypothetical protein
VWSSWQDAWLLPKRSGVQIPPPQPFLIMNTENIANKIDIELILANILKPEKDLIYDGLRFDESKRTIDVYFTKSPGVKSVKITFSVGNK